MHRLAAGKPEEAAALARIVLLRLPRHLPTYQRLVRATWMLKRWQEGEDWARRLLQADPGNAAAWRSLAQSVEQKALLPTARAMWKRAFEADPYDPDIRLGLSRTSLERADALDAGCCLPGQPLPARRPLVPCRRSLPGPGAGR